MPVARTATLEHRIGAPEDRQHRIGAPEATLAAVTVLLGEVGERSVARTAAAGLAQLAAAERPADQRAGCRAAADGVGEERTHEE